MKKSIINKHIIITALLLLGLAQVSAVTYPNVNETQQLDIKNQTMLNKDVLESFLDSFAIPTTTDFDSIAQKVALGASPLQSLRSVVNIQTIQLDKIKREKLPKFSFLNTPQTPLYGYRNNTSLAGVSLATTVESHTFGLSGGVKQQLPTAGAIDLSLSNSSTYSKVGAATWGWKQSPSATLSYSQPLFINKKIIDFSYAKTVLDRQVEKQEMAMSTLESTRDSLSLSALSLLHTYQGLKETRWALMQDAIVSEVAVEDAKYNLTLGLVSENQLTQQINGYKQLLLQIDELDNQIASMMSSLTSFGLESNNGEFPLIKISYSDIVYVSSFSGKKLVSSEDMLIKALSNDSDYRSALSGVRDAQAGIDLGNPSDAPIINVSMNYAPFISATGGADFGQSFSDIFSSTTKQNVSVSVSVIASDLGRSLSKSTKALAKEQLVQAQIALDDARDGVVETLRSMQSSINTALEKVKITTSSYEMASEMVEIEKIKASVGQSSDEAIKRAEIGMYRSAFSLLSSIRTVYELKVSLETMMKE